VPPDVDNPTLELLDKQLARYQQIIARLAGNSVQVKTWCFTATAAIASAAIDRESSAIFVVAIVLLAAFFYLDSYYLALERHFRRASTDLADRVIASKEVSSREFVVIASAEDASGWRHVIRCGVGSHTSVIYAVVAGGLVVGVLATA
jgi:hypothetical protein